MKRTICFALGLFMICACMLSAGCVRKDDNIMWFESSMVKITSETKRGTDTSYTVYLAKNEYEGCQAAILPNEYYSDTTVKISVPTDKNGNTLSYEIYKESYVSTMKVDMFFSSKDPEMYKWISYPDGLEPWDESKSCSISSDEPTVFYILFHADKDTEAGDYKAEFSVEADGAILESGTVTAHVWNFVLPDSHTMETASDLSKYYISKVTGLEGDELDEMYLKYFDFMLEHKMCPYDLPYGILDERVDKYLDDPRVSSFRVYHDANNDDLIRAYYEKLSTKKEWLDKAYFYFIDEPGTVDAYEKIHFYGERLSELFPEYRMVSPFFQDVEMPDGRDAVDYVSDVINIWCPKLFCLDPDNKLFYNTPFLQNQKPLAERMKDRVKEGDDLWWYVCWEPGEPYANLYVNMQGVVNRGIFWQAYQYDVTGFLFWSSNYWNSVKNPWESMSTVSKLIPNGMGENCYGDGSLLYPGNFVGYDGPCSSLRLEAVRDGVDDYEYITMARELGVPEKTISSLVGTVAKSVTDYTKNDENLVKARISLGKLIESRTIK